VAGVGLRWLGRYGYRRKRESFTPCNLPPQTAIDTTVTNYYQEIGT
jgi:hypothetical protein